MLHLVSFATFLPHSHIINRQLNESYIWVKKKMLRITNAQNSTIYMTKVWSFFGQFHAEFFRMAYGHVICAHSSETKSPGTVSACLPRVCMKPVSDGVVMVINWLVNQHPAWASCVSSSHINKMSDKAVRSQCAVVCAFSVFLCHLWTRSQCSQCSKDSSLRTLKCISVSNPALLPVFFPANPLQLCSVVSPAHHPHFLRLPPPRISSLVPFVFKSGLEFGLCWVICCVRPGAAALLSCFSGSFWNNSSTDPTK